MQRREAAKSLLMGIGGMILMPEWANAWNSKNLGNSDSFTANEDTLLAEIVDTIIPETKTIGAKRLEVHKLIQRIVTDCQGPEAVAKLKSGLAKINEIVEKKEGAKFEKLSPAFKLGALKAIENGSDPEAKKILANIRKMTISGFTKSEYFMTEVLKFEFVPGRFVACKKI